MAKRSFVTTIVFLPLFFLVIAFSGCASPGGDGGGDTVNNIDQAWVQDAYLKASNSGTDDYFGKSVAISGDLIVVGAYDESSNATSINNTDSWSSYDNNHQDSGAAYVFKKDADGDWSQDAYLKASNSEADDNFGESVAISGDVIVVGAYMEDSNATSVENIDGTASDDDTNSASGAVYVFKKDAAGDWSQDAYLKASNNGNNDYFGFSVAISGDLIVVGANYEASNATSIENMDNTASDDDTSNQNGAAYIFKR